MTWTPLNGKGKILMTQATEKADQARVKADEAEAAHRKAHKVWADAFYDPIYLAAAGRVMAAEKDLRVTKAVADDANQALSKALDEVWYAPTT